MACCLLKQSQGVARLGKDAKADAGAPYGGEVGLGRNGPPTCGPIGAPVHG
jgi:hypothetical protein